MPRIVLKDLESERTLTVLEAEATIGRDPACAVVADGPNSRVVSGHHARIFFQNDAWWIEDSSRNGTILDDERLRRGERYSLKPGQVVGLGETGPRYRILALEGRRVADTVMEPRGAHASAPDPGAIAATDPVQTTAMRRSEAVRAGLDLDAPPAAPQAHPPTGPQAPGSAAAPDPQGHEGPTEPMGPAPDWVVRLVVRETHTNQRWDVRGDTIRIGRAPECLIQIPADQGASVSRVHAEVAIADGGVTVRDAGSRNGTFVNGKRLPAPQEVRKSDLIMLGAGGPTLSVEDLRIVKADKPPAGQDGGGSAPAHATAPRGSGEPQDRDSSPAGTRASASKRRTASDAAAQTRRTPEDRGARTPAKPGVVARAMGPATRLARRSFAGMGRTAFFRDVLEDMSQKSARRVRAVVWSSVVATVGVASGVLWYTQQRVSESEQRLASERAAYEARSDSIRLAAATEAEQLRAAFDSARAASAPRAIVDSLRNALADAARRTGALEAALQRAQLSLNQQLAAGDAARRRAEDEMNRLRLQVGQAQAGAMSGALLDSLRGALRAAEERAAVIDNQLRAVRSSNADLAQVAHLNQGAVGLVTTYMSGSESEGTGFALTPSGYFVTNRHVVREDNGTNADSVFVTMADRRYGSWHRADVIRVGSGEVDIALLKLRNYAGPYVQRADWRANSVRQGEPAALIGFPRGTMMALDNADTVRTTMTAGIFSKVTPGRIQFDGFSQGGSSGSPVFAATGEVVAVHFAGLRGAVGMAFAIPLTQVLPLLPADARSELGIR